ncbi:MAG: hypothetical protein KatS3mg109_0782 [Pirellulaceae bacterium]|nr:MAG: hypothetical protein KatS3mg109_0782 [Pirellulaceae bacterium]
MIVNYTDWVQFDDDTFHRHFYPAVPLGNDYTKRVRYITVEFDYDWAYVLITEEDKEDDWCALEIFTDRNKRIRRENVLRAIDILFDLPPANNAPTYDE